MKQEGWPQKDTTHALDVSEGAVSQWLPHAVQTRAPSGQTPHLVVKQTKDHFSAISGITPDGRLFLQVLREDSYDSEAEVRLPARAAAQGAQAGNSHLRRLFAHASPHEPPMRLLL